METKHTPATPLPWGGMNSNADMAQGIVQADTGADIAVFCGKGKSRMNAAYAYHAANAYPRLVALAKHLRAVLNAKGGSTADERGEANALYNKLLRELGEAE